MIPEKFHDEQKRFVQVGGMNVPIGFTIHGFTIRGIDFPPLTEETKNAWLDLYYDTLLSDEEIRTLDRYYIQDMFTLLYLLIRVEDVIRKGADPSETWQKAWDVAFELKYGERKDQRTKEGKGDE